MKRWVTTDGQEIYCVKTLRSNAYIVKCKEKYLLIDTGVKYSLLKILRAFKKLGVTEENLVALILTHTHYDHVENAHRIKQLYGTNIMVHEREATFLEEGNSPQIKGTIYITRKLQKSINKGLEKIGKYSPVIKDIMIDESLALHHLGFNGYIMHTPGHTIGSMSVVLNNEYAIVGDTMFGVIKGSILPPYAMDLGVLMESWKKLLDTECSIFLTGHGLPNTRQCAKLTYERINKKLSKITER